MQGDPANIISLTDTAMESSFVEVSGKDFIEWGAAKAAARGGRRARLRQKRYSKQTAREKTAGDAMFGDAHRRIKEEARRIREEAEKFMTQWKEAKPPLIRPPYDDVKNPYVARVLTDISDRVRAESQEQRNELLRRWAFFGFYQDEQKKTGCSDKDACESVLSCDGECKWPYTDPEGKMLAWPESVQKSYQEVLKKMDDIKQRLRQGLVWPQNKPEPTHWHRLVWPKPEPTHWHRLPSVELLPSAEPVVKLQKEISQALGEGDRSIADEEKKPEIKAYRAKEQDFKYHMEKHEKIRNSDFDPRGDSYIHSLTPRPTPTSSPLPDLSSRKYWSSSPPPPPPPPPAYARGGKGRI